MHVSVVICTWNRCELLLETLESLRALIVPAGVQWELLVVDNHSSDASSEVIASYREVLPLCSLREVEVGLSRARNTAARAVVGDLILFTDDDVRVDPNWMKAYVEAAHRWPGAGYFGGEIRPEFAAEVPPWVKRNRAALAGMLCARDLGSVEGRLRLGEFPYGPNMAVRRDSLGLASFDERVGRKGDAQVRGCEGSFFRSLERQGVRGVWVPEAKIRHYIPACRANSRYLWRYYHGSGRSQVRLSVACGLYPRWRVLSAALRELAKSCVWSWAWPRHLATLAWMSGALFELKQLSVRRGVVQGDEMIVVVEEHP